MIPIAVAVTAPSVVVAVVGLVIRWIGPKGKNAKMINLCIFVGMELSTAV